MCTELLVVINCDYRSKSAGFVNTRFTEYGWRGAKREFVHSMTVYVCCQEDTFSVNHSRVIWSLWEAGTEASECSQSEVAGSWKFSIALKKRISRLRQEDVARSCLLHRSCSCYSRTVQNSLYETHPLDKKTNTKVIEPRAAPVCPRWQRYSYSEHPIVKLRHDCVRWF